MECGQVNPVFFVSSPRTTHLIQQAQIGGEKKEAIAVCKGKTDQEKKMESGDQKVKPGRRIGLRFQAPGRTGMFLSGKRKYRVETVARGRVFWRMRTL